MLWGELESRGTNFMIEGSIEGNKAYTKGSLTETTKTCPACLSLGWLMYEGICLLEHVPEKAAGTPTMYPLDVLNSSARLTLFPGESSRRTSVLGISWPTRTEARGVEWKLRAATAMEEVGLAKATRRRGARRDMARCVLRRFVR